VKEFGANPVSIIFGVKKNPWRMGSMYGFDLFLLKLGSTLSIKLPYGNPINNEALIYLSV
jgi:hypothetical protein